LSWALAMIEGFLFGPEWVSALASVPLSMEQSREHLRRASMKEVEPSGAMLQMATSYSGEPLQEATGPLDLFD